MGKTVGTILAIKDKCTPQLENIAKKLDLDAKEAKKLNAQIVTLSKQMNEGFKKASTVCMGAIAATAAATGAMINNSIKAGDRIDKMSQKMQMSRKTFQELEYVFAQNGANIEIMQGATAKLSKSMDGARLGNKANILMFRRLGISLKDAKGGMKSTESVMLESIAKLQKMREGARRSSLALELFGKSAVELAPILNGNAKDVEELRKKFNDLGMGLSDEQINSAVKIGDTIDDIKRSFQGLALQIGADFLPIIQEMADKFIKEIPKIKTNIEGVIGNVIDTFKFLKEHIDKITRAVTIMAGVWGTCTIINAVANSVSFLANAIQVCCNAQGLWNILTLRSVTLQKAKYLIDVISTGVLNVYCAVKSIMIALINKEARTIMMLTAVQKAQNLAMLAGNIIMKATPFGLFIGFCTLLYGALVLLHKNWDKVTEAAKKFGEKVKEIWEKIKPVFDKIGKFFNGDKQIKTAVETVQTTKNITQNEEIRKIKEVPAMIGPVKKHALGTSYSNGGVSLVGEYGPELVTLQRGARVIPANETKNIMNNSNKNVEVNINVAGNIYGEDDFINKVINRFTLELNRALI